MNTQRTLKDYAFEIGYGSSEVVFKYNDQIVSEEEWTEACMNLEEMAP